jgi:hypothetical protein
MQFCREVKGNGQPCKAPATGEHGYCWAHHPDNRGKVSRQRSRAAKSKKNTEAKILKEELKQLKVDVLAGNVDRRDADVVVRIYNAIRGFMELERGIREQDELVAEIEELKREYSNAS